MKSRTILLLVTLIMTIAACSSTYKAVQYRSSWSNPDGTTGEVETIVTAPVDSVDPVEFSITPNEGTATEHPTITATGGAVAEVDQAISDLSSHANKFAILLIVAGVGSIILRSWIPIIPINASVMLIGLGIGLYAIPVLVDRYAVYMMVAVGIAAALWIYGIWDNKRMIDTPVADEKQTT